MQKSANKMKPRNSVWLILIIAVITRVSAVPDEFCLDAFDDGDCGEPPTSVLYYYKPGSRCEVRTWRGCPTLNKFPDYFSCVHFCIGRIWGEPLDIPVLSASAEAAETAETAKIIKVAEIIDAQNNWKQEIKELTAEKIKKIDTILEDVVEEMEHHHQKLSLTINNAEKSGYDLTTEQPTTVAENFTYTETEVIVVL